MRNIEHATRSEMVRASHSMISEGYTLESTELTQFRNIIFFPLEYLPLLLLVVVVFLVVELHYIMCLCRSLRGQYTKHWRVTQKHSMSCFILKVTKFDFATFRSVCVRGMKK